MSKFTLAVLVIFITNLSVRCLAESLDDVEHYRKMENYNLLDDEPLDRAATAYGSQAVNDGWSKPGPYPRKLTECYVCVDCPDVLVNTTSKVCPSSNDRSKHNKCIVYSEKYRNMKKAWYIRGCASERGSCADIRKAHEQHEHIVRLENCMECEGDRCNINGVSRSIPNLITGFIVLVLTPAFGKFTIS